VVIKHGKSKRKRTYVRGKPLRNDLRSLIIDEIIHSGGNIITREYPGNFSAIAKQFSVHDCKEYLEQLRREQNT
jgi:hypothetical protein